MKVQKFLVLGLAMCGTCSSTGFQAGVNTGADYGKYSIKGEEEKVNLSKTRILFEGVLGYEHKFTSVVVGFNLMFGNAFGTIKKKIEEEGDEAVEQNLKSKFHISAMPKIGYMCTPNFSIYITAGARYVRRESWETGRKDNAETKGRIHPVVGLGGKYDFGSGFFLKLEYNYLLRSKVKSSAESSIKYFSHGVIAGAGYTF